MDNKKGQRLFDPARASRLMDEAGLDAILASRRHNVAYLSDQFSILYWEYPEVAHCLDKEDDGCEAPYYFAAVARDPAVQPFVAAHSGRASIWKGGWIEDIRGACDKPGKANSVDRIADALGERGLAGGTIGVEMNHIPAATLLKLQARLPNAIFKDATPTLWKMRMVKTELELARQRRAYEIAGSIYTAVFRALKERPGITVGEIRGMQMAMAAEAGCPPIHFGYVFPQDGRTKFAWRTGDPSVRVAAGDAVLLDLGLIYRGYTTDFGRGVVLGRASSTVKESYQQMLDLREVVSSAIRPGVRACGIHQIGADYCDKIGWARPGSLGHSIGIECHEPPLLMPDDGTVIEEGMTVVVELVTHADGLYFLLEDAGVVTKDGWKSLAAMSPDLLEIV